MGDTKKKSSASGKKQRKIPWDKLENEYISSRVSYNELSEKHKIPKRQIERYASEHQWVAKRREIVGEVSANVKKAIINDETNKQLDYLSEIGEAAKKIIEVVTKAVEDEKQFFRRSFYSEQEKKVVEYETEKIDGAAVNQVLKALEKVTDIYCSAYGIEREENTKKYEINVTMPEGAKEYGE